jgi:hypothetical protein
MLLLGGVFWPFALAGELLATVRTLGALAGVFSLALMAGSFFLRAAAPRPCCGSDRPGSPSSHYPTRFVLA